MHFVLDIADLFMKTTPILAWAFLTFGFWLIENGMKYRWSQRIPNILCGLVVCLVYLITAPFVIKSAQFVFGYTGDGLIEINPLPQYPGLSLFLSIVLFIFVLDFFFYWWHRAEHKIPVLWDIHAVHHSEEDFNATSYMRQNWMDGFLQGLFVQIPVIAIFHFPTGVPQLAFLGVAAWNFFGHADLKWEMGTWSFLVMGPQLHRLHHSKLKQHYDRNFTQFFPFWDILFGTYVPPLPGEFPPTGLGPNLQIQNNLPDFVSYPLKSWWRRSQRRSVGESS